MWLSAGLAQGQSPDRQPVTTIQTAQQAWHDNQPIDSVSYLARSTVQRAEQAQQWNASAYALTWLGGVYRDQEQFDSAFHYLSRALVTVTSNSLPDSTVATTYYHLGLYYRKVNRPEQAVEVFRRALAIRETMDDPVALAEVCRNIAHVYRFAYSDFITAEQFYQRALNLLEDTDDQPAEDMFPVLYGLAITNRLKEDYDKALSYGYRAITLSKKLSARQQERCFTMLGNILEDKEELPTAIKNFEQALSLGITRLGSNRPELMIRYNNLAGAYIAADSVRQGLAMLRHAEQLYQTQQEHLRDNLALTYELRGDAFHKLRKPKLASANYRKSLTISRTFFGDKHQRTARILSTIAQLHRDQSQLDSALYYQQRAIIAGVLDFDQTDIAANPTVAMMQNNPMNFRLLDTKGQLLMEKSSSVDTLKLALACYVQTDSLVDVSRGLFDRELAKLSFLEVNRQLYERAVNVAYQLHQKTSDDQYLSWAFHLMEKSRAVVLWESLFDSQIKNGVGIPDSLLSEEQAIHQELAFINNQLFTNNRTNNVADSTLTKWRDRKFTLSRQREALTQLLQKEYPRYFQIKYGRAGYTLAEAQQYAESTGKSLVEYLWGEQYVYAIGLSSSYTAMVQIPLSDSLRQALTTVQQALQHPPQINQRQLDFERYTTAAHHLYRRLLLPVLPSPTRRNEIDWGALRFWEEKQVPAISIVPDGPLAYLPFEALLTDQPAPSAPVDYRRLHYVVDQFAINYAQSVQVLAQQTPSAPSRQAMRFLAFGYDENAPESSLPGLPGTAQEVRALGKMAEGTYYLGPDATESRFKSEVQQYDLIHLAVHGQADTLGRNNSRLMFRTEPDSPEDGFLYSFELYDLQVAADLVVLSACESGTGKLQPGEGVYSLARGFTYAGCPTVVMSLWKVDDQRTAELMPSFYDALYEGNSVSQALRTSQLQYRQQCQSFFAHPAFWSAFVVGGATEPVVSYQTTHYAIWIILLLSVIYLGIALYRYRKNKSFHHA